MEFSEEKLEVFQSRKGFNGFVSLHKFCAP